MKGVPLEGYEGRLAGRAGCVSLGGAGRILGLPEDRSREQ